MSEVCIARTQLARGGLPCSMFKESQPVVENYQARVRTILNDEQEAEWEKMRAEAKERFKEQYKSSNGPQ